jgi:DNA-binding NarL/FixJ family response regulator
MEPFMESYKIILAEGHLRFRQLTRKFIEENDELTVVGEANDGMELLELLGKSLPDMVIISISMPRLRGMETAKRVKEIYPKIKVLILTVHKEKDYLEWATSNGVDGYILKQEMDEELNSAIQSVRSGKFYMSSLLEANR